MNKLPILSRGQLAGIAVIILILTSWISFRVGKNDSTEDIGYPNGTAVACTEEAKICPDGSSVGRTGPNCEFTLCPNEISASSGTSSATTSVRSNPISGKKIITPPTKNNLTCASDTRVCQNGLPVHRAAPSCDFTECPTTLTQPYLKGIAIISPACSVTKNSNGGVCKDTPYVGTLIVWNTDGSYLKSFESKSDGTFETTLNPGIYTITSPKNTQYPVPRVSKQVEIFMSKTTEIKLILDSVTR